MPVVRGGCAGDGVGWRRAARAWLGGLALCCAAAAPATAQSDVAPLAGYDDVAATLSTFIRHERAEKDVPAISVAVVDSGRVVWARGFGWADSAASRAAGAATAFRLGDDVAALLAGAPQGPPPRDSARGRLWSYDGESVAAPGPGVDESAEWASALTLARILAGGAEQALRDGEAGGGAPGFAATVGWLPGARGGVVALASLDAARAVTDRIVHVGLAALRAHGQGVAPPSPGTSRPLPPGRALALQGRYAGRRDTVVLREYEGRLFLSATAGGTRHEVRALRGDTLVLDDALSCCARLVAGPMGRLTLGQDTLARVATIFRPSLVTEPRPDSAPAALRPVVGEYGVPPRRVFLLERDGRLEALVDRFFVYPLQSTVRDVYRLAGPGKRAGHALRLRRDRGGSVVALVLDGEDYPRRTLPGDDDRVSFRIEPVRPPAALRAEALAATPPREAGRFRSPDLVELRTLEPSIHYDIRYATGNNFMGVPFYTEAHAFLQRPAAEALVRVSRRLRALGYGLLVHDAYRPWYVTKMFWDATPAAQKRFVADPARGSRHNRGAAVDLTLYDLRTGRPLRMTGGYDEFSERSYPLYPGGTSLQRWRRDLLRHAMEAEGFTVYGFEWWHFDYRDWRHYPILNLTFEELEHR